VIIIALGGAVDHKTIEKNDAASIQPLKNPVVGLGFVLRKSPQSSLTIHVV
jgi:hypothetical protein